MTLKRKANKERSTRFIEMFDRNTFLDCHLKSVTEQQLDKFDHRVVTSRGKPVCSICRSALLKDITYSLKPEYGNTSFERAVRLPCGHIFGEDCVRRHFETLDMHDLYHDYCPRCNRQLYTQDAPELRRAKIAQFKQNIIEERKYRQICHFVVQPCMWLMTATTCAAVWLPMFGFGWLLSFAVFVLGVAQFLLVFWIVVRLFFPRHRKQPERAEDGTPLLGDRFI